MRKRHAKLIRIGIMSKCYPYKTGSDIDSRTGNRYYYETLDFVRLWKFRHQYELHRDHPLVIRAAERTDHWTIQKNEDDHV